ncbi:Glycosyl transferase, family 14-containing protein [Strongyloides ratti]|uniref:Glycosyl transferase, family 14-containing protein n=1 Tax=Strongyloides ratti TaxID=34506 RepID=A0A090LSL2_STRRB|nr:Glycosyl transferase, family 14-containing protein [Strongyloides ratti]CEF70598.1 Glycosyl transferase, family 14-containing protein [Strongyloides ratti]
MPVTLKEKRPSSLMCEQFESNFLNSKFFEHLATTENDSQPLTCELIKKRRYFTLVTLSKEEENFPLAYSFLVYKDYEVLELILFLIYQPQNIYCYTIDKKQPMKI